MCKRVFGSQGVILGGFKETIFEKKNLIGTRDPPPLWAWHKPWRMTPFFIPSLRREASPIELFTTKNGFISDWYEEFVLDTAPRINTKFFFLLQKESFLDVKRKGEREDIKWQNAIFSVLRSYLEINTIALVAQVLQSHLQKNRLRRFGWDVSSDVHFESKDVSSDSCPFWIRTLLHLSLSVVWSENSSKEETGTSVFTIDLC